MPWFSSNEYKAVACLGLYKTICEYSNIRPMVKFCINNQIASICIFSWCLLHKPESRKNKLLTGQPLRWKLSFWRFFLDFVVSFLKKSKVLSFKWNQLFLSQCFSISIHSILSNIQILNVHQLMTRGTSHFITFQYVCFFTLFPFYSWKEKNLNLE